jgi:hypothetical protein
MVDAYEPVWGEMSAEAALSDRHQRSVEDAFTAMAPRLWRALLLYTGNHEVADEAVSEAFSLAVGASTEIRDVRARIWASAFPHRPRRAEAQNGARRPYRLSSCLTRRSTRVPTRSVSTARAARCSRPRRRYRGPHEVGLCGGVRGNLGRCPGHLLPP